MRKTISIIASAALIACLGCTKDNEKAFTDRLSADVTFTVSSGDLDTKADKQTDSDKAVSSLDVIVFNTDGALEASLHTTGALITNPVSLTMDEKTVYAFANLPSGALSTLTSKPACEAYHPEFAQNAPGAFFMKGKRVVTIEPSTDQVSLSVSRDVYKVVIAAAPTFSGAAAGGSFEAAYLINVPKTYAPTTAYSMSDGAYLWNFDTAAKTGSEQDDMLRATSWTLPLYGYPNASSAASSVNGKDAVTKLVIKAKVGGKTQWYPIGLQGTASNRLYTVNGVSISGLGADDPNKYVGHDVIGVDVSVTDWSTGVLTSSHIHKDGMGVIFDDIVP